MLLTEIPSIQFTLAASAQRQIGYAIAGIVLLAMVIYWFFNWIEGRKEAGSEIELAANRKPAMSDEDMETKRLDMALAGGLALLIVIAIGTPLYWLGEPGRHSGLIDFTDDQAVKKGANLYEENCAQCHGSANGDGGAALDYSLVDPNGFFVEQVDWTAPSLGAVLDRFSYAEVKYILNYGRSNSPMPAWGAPGGGPLTDQQVDNVIAYIAAEQKTQEEISKGVREGLPGAALKKAQAEDLATFDRLNIILEELSHDIDDEATKSALETERDELEGVLDDAAAKILADSETDQVILGELLFNNPAAGGAYGCSRCHSAGASINANAYPDNELVGPVIHGSGGLAPSLIGVADQFSAAEEQVGFIAIGTKNGRAYGAYGQGDGGGQMPGFGGCWASDDEIPRHLAERIADHCDEIVNEETGEVIRPGRTGTLTEAQIEAIVAYERSLD